MPDDDPTNTTHEKKKRNIMFHRKIVFIGILGVIYLSICRWSSYTQSYEPLLLTSTTTTIKKKKDDQTISPKEVIGLVKELTISNNNDTAIIWDDKFDNMKKETTNSGSETLSILNDNHEPYLNRWQRRFASSKKRQKQGGYLFFRHMRKAGGTSLRDYFRDVMLYHNITRNLDDFRDAKYPSTHYQVHYIEHEFQPMDWKCPIVDPRWNESMRIIVLRHPIERHLSEYFFSGSGKEFAPIDKEQLYVNKTYTDHMKEFLSKQLPKWMNGIGRSRKKEHVEGKFNMIFGRHYTDNFQLRALAGCSSPTCMNAKKATEEQREKVNKFHPNVNNYTNPVPRCTQYYRKEDKSALFEQCAKEGHISKDECPNGCDGPCFYPSIGWGELGNKDLVRAKTLLRAFDAVLLMEKLDDMDQSDFLQDVMSVPRDADFSLAKRHTTANTGVEKSDKREKSRFYRDLLTNLGLESILTSLEEENQLEIDFFQYAEKLNEAMIDQWKRETA